MQSQTVALMQSMLIDNPQIGRATIMSVTMCIKLLIHVDRPQVYILELVPALLDCLHRLCASHTVIYLAFYERSKVAGDLFWKMLPERFSHVKVPEESFGMGYHADCLPESCP